MKTLIFGSLISFALISFTGCANKIDTEAGTKCSTSVKCSGDKAKEMATKCSSSTKCGN